MVVFLDTERGEKHMKKKIVALVLIGSMALSFTACAIAPIHQKKQKNHPRRQKHLPKLQKRKQKSLSY